eukprot:scaffold4556_cov256-Prasinococcus_capsulatus_cf.AAC.2
MRAVRPPSVAASAPLRRATGPAYMCGRGARGRGALRLRLSPHPSSSSFLAPTTATREVVRRVSSGGGGERRAASAGGRACGRRGGVLRCVALRCAQGRASERASERASVARGVT